MNRLVNAAFASSTKLTYDQALRSFDAFRVGQALPQAWPAPQEHIVQFAAFLSLENKSHATARTYVAAISTFHKLKGWSDPTNNFLLRKLLQGFARSKKHTDSRLPITFDKLIQLGSNLHNICTDAYEVLLFKAAYTLAFFGFLRVNELVGQSKPDKISRAGLQLTDIQLGSILQVQLRASKTDQHGLGTKIQLQAVHKAPAVCPVRAMRAYLASRPKNSNQLLVHFNSRPLTRYQFQAVLKKAALFLGWDTSRFSSHSFRIGAATTAANNGTPIEFIMKKGRWRSSAVTSYIRADR